MSGFGPVRALLPDNERYWLFVPDIAIRTIDPALNAL
jgi:hypothetical protein